MPLKWIKSYFSNRLQFFARNGHVSSRTNISCGVPQGSILGPLFFLLYINDINNASEILQLIHVGPTQLYTVEADPVFKDVYLEHSPVEVPDDAVVEAFSSFGAVREITHLK